MNDQELLFNAIKFCIAYTNRQGDCKNNCPLSNNICIDKEGNLRLYPAKSEINFVEFTQQFRKMIQIITDWENKNED